MYSWIAPQQLIDLSKLIESSLLYMEIRTLSYSRNNKLSSEATISSALQCLMSFWKYGIHSLHRSSVPSLFEQIFRILPLSSPLLTHFKRIDILLSLQPYFSEYDEYEYEYEYE